MEPGLGKHESDALALARQWECAAQRDPPPSGEFLAADLKVIGDELVRLRGELQELRAALQPFAQAAGALAIDDPAFPDNGAVMRPSIGAYMRGQGMVEPQARDLRRSHHLLSRSSQHDNAPQFWRCFHCDEVFTDPILARMHFGPDQAVDTACVSPLRTDETARRRELVEAWDDAAALRRQNEQLDHEAGCYHAMVAELERSFKGARTVHQAWLEWEEMEGRALAAEEKATRLLQDAKVIQELAKAAEAFRVAMIESGATSRVSQDQYFPQLRRLETALAALPVGSLEFRARTALERAHDRACDAIDTAAAHQAQGPT